MHDTIFTNGSGTVRHNDLPCSDGSGGSGDSRLPPRHATVIRKCGLPSHNCAPQANDATADRLSALKPASVHRKSAAKTQDFCVNSAVGTNPENGAQKRASASGHNLPGGDERASDGTLDPHRFAVITPAPGRRSPTTPSVAGPTEPAAGSRQQPHALTCGGCEGAGINPRFPTRPCDFCGGSGLYLDERRVELVDAISDALSDTNDLDVDWFVFARAVVALLERRGLDVTALTEVA